MTSRCLSECPAGDCAGCVFPPPRPIARCVPSNCAQRAACARAAVKPDGHTQDFDASRCKTSDGWCPLFVDSRGAALLARAA